jgi:uncharacterized protein
MRPRSLMRSQSDLPGGFQIAFLVFAIVFLAYPMQKYIGPFLGIQGAERSASRIFIFAPLALLLALYPPFRNLSIQMLGTPITAGRGREAAVVTACKALLVPFATAGAIVLWHWGLGGEMGLARRLGEQQGPEAALRSALTVEGFIFWVVVAGVVAPVIEELVFRGLLYRAWEARWGWFWSMMGTSALFALYHPVPFSAFVSAVIFVAVYRRTGSIWAPILVHAVGNLLMSPLLIGRYYFQTAGKETGEIGLWWCHLAALAILLPLIALYAWLARNPQQAEQDEPATEIRCA